MIHTAIDHLPRYRLYRTMVKNIEQFLDTNDFLKVQVPTLSPALIPESYLEIFATEYIFFDHISPRYLTPSPELFMKRLLAAGVGNCYYLGSAYRNSEPTSSRHNGEFTILEWYKINTDYLGLANEVLRLLQTLSEHKPFTFRGKQYMCDAWEMYTVAQAFDTFAHIPEHVLFDTEAFIAHARHAGYVTEHFAYEDLWSQIYTAEVEPHLGTHGRPTLLYDYPLTFAALSKPNSDGKTAQRFEFYIDGLELGNCYTELTDATIQKQRLLYEIVLREKNKKITHIPDWGFIDVLEKGMPPCAGIAIGVERLGMIFTDANNITDLQLINYDID